MARTHHHSLAWRVNRAIESAGARRPIIKRTGPAWMFGLMGLVAEALLAPVVLALTIVVAICSYVLLDTPWTRVRAQQRPRFVSVRILYLNTLIVAGFWLAVMFTFSAADPVVSNGVEQRLPALLEVATARDLKSLVSLKKSAGIKPVYDGIAPVATWFDVFIHGLICALAINFLLYGVVIARRRQRVHHGMRHASRPSLHYDSQVGLFVDDEREPPR
ncbi:MAG: hypothetical protein ABJE47_00275 [bacterium]